ncbi:MAG: hypothetical protein GY699_11545 [Desulfobacteraceae bacterium]|nr:hypothetical protein [Desulfobacteraceae bacterium]
MILHDFIYDWDGKSKNGEKPVSWWPGSYHVKIVDLAADNNISYLVPIAVILKNAKSNPAMNTSLRNYIHNFAQKISKKYDLDLEKTLWVEIDNTIRVTRLHPDPKVIPATLYAISWRPIMPNELEMIAPYLGDM